MPPCSDSTSIYGASDVWLAMHQCRRNIQTEACLQATIVYPGRWATWADPRQCFWNKRGRGLESSEVSWKVNLKGQVRFGWAGGGGKFQKSQCICTTVEDGGGEQEVCWNNAEDNTQHDEAGLERWDSKQDACPGEEMQRNSGRWCITREEDKMSVWENGGQRTMNRVSVKPWFGAHVIREMITLTEQEKWGWEDFEREWWILKQWWIFSMKCLWPARTVSKECGGWYKRWF